MPGRYIREGILTSKAVNSLSPTAELFYRRLLNVIDDHGRYYANVLHLFSACYPTYVDDMNQEKILAFNKQIEHSKTECEDAGLIVIYGEKNNYLQVRNFGQKARSNNSKYPEPTDQEMESKSKPFSNCKTDVKQLYTLNDNGNGNVNGIVSKDTLCSEPEKSVPNLSPAKRIKFDEGQLKIIGIIDDDIERWEKAYPAVDIEGEMLRASEWLINNPRKRPKKNISQFLYNWYNRTQQSGGSVSKMNGLLPTLEEAIEFSAEANLPQFGKMTYEQTKCELERFIKYYESEGLGKVSWQQKLKSWKTSG